MSPPDMATDCSYPEQHAAASAHQSHPDGPRLICVICHPPLGLADPTAKSRGLTPRGASATSQRTAALAFPRTGTQRKRVLAAVWRAGESGATRDELAQHLGVSPNTVRPRVKELMDGGWVKVSDMTRPTPLGHDAEVLVVTDTALIEINQRVARKEGSDATAA